METQGHKALVRPPSQPGLFASPLAQASTMSARAAALSKPQLMLLPVRRVYTESLRGAQKDVMPLPWVVGHERPVSNTEWQAVTLPGKPGAFWEHPQRCSEASGGSHPGSREERHHGRTCPGAEDHGGQLQEPLRDSRPLAPRQKRGMT